jgi:AAA domain-containing protein
MTGDNITALAKYQEAHRNGHSSAGEEIPIGDLVKRMSDVEDRSVRWAWEGRLAVGYMTVQTGEEGLGKSVFNAWLIARATRGELDGAAWRGQPVGTLVVASEDGHEDTWKPRLTLADADTDRVFTLNLDKLPAGWNIRDGIEDLRRAITTTDSKLVVFDALLDHMPPAAAGETINSPTFVRGALGPLQHLVRELEIVAIVSLHPPKSRGFAFRDFVQGSQAFSAISRFGLLFAWHPDDADDDPQRRRVIVRGKGNLGRDPGALEFTVIGREHEHSDGHIQEREVVVNVRPSDVTLQQLMARARGAGDEPHGKSEEAASVIAEQLADHGWHSSEPIVALRRERELGSGSVVDRAKKLLGVESRKAPGSAYGGWEWRIPRLGESKNPLKNPSVLENPATDSWTEKGPNPQQPREESKNPSSVTADSSARVTDIPLHEPACGHSSRWWRLRGGPLWVCELCHSPHPGADIVWSDAQGGIE